MPAARRAQMWKAHSDVLSSSPRPRMSLSRRSSSRSIAPRRPILSISKASAAPSLSLIFAEPEPRKRKDSSASASLKEMWGKEKEPETETNKLEATKPVVAEDDTATDVPQVEVNCTPEVVAPQAMEPSPAVAQPEAEPPLTPTPTPPTTTSAPVPQSLQEPDNSPNAASTVSFPSTSPPSRSWFGSLGRSRGRDKAKVYVESMLKESTIVADDPVESAASDDDTTPTPSQPPSSAPQAIPFIRSSPPPLHTALSMTSSIDEHVPSLPSTPPAELEVPQRQRVTSSPSRDLNSLNPSTSRFSLSIPLLGRPKVPLDEALIKSAPPTMASQVEQHPPPAQAEEPLNKEDTTVTTSVQETVKEEVYVSGHAVSSSSSSTYSWWSYVGWGPVEQHAEDQTAAGDAGENQTSGETEEPKPEPTPEPQEPPQEERPSIPVERTTSILSSETTSHASWYSPWAWYSSPVSAPVDEQPEVEQPTSDGLTPSERVKEEALARSEPPPESIETAASTAIIESTATNRSGWTSFFTSVNRKTIEAGSVKRDEHGNEIMDLDEEDESAPAPMNSASPNPPQSPTKPTSAPPSKPEAPSTPTRKPGLKRNTAPQLTISEEVKKEASTSHQRKTSIASPVPKEKKKEKKPVPPPPPVVPNLVLPTWDEIFKTPPRLQPTPPPKSARLLQFITGKGKSREDDLPFLLEGTEYGWAKACKRVVVFGIHGWFPGAIMRSMLGEPTGTSPKFVAMMEEALGEFQKRHGIKFEKITGMPLEGEGTISGRVEKLYKALTENTGWMADLHDADAILVATHSQGSVVSTHLLNRLIEEGHIVTALGSRAMPDELVGVRKVQRVCCLALCGIHLGPLRYLNSSSLLQPYFQYLETQAARELFEFQNTDSDVSRAYVSALKNVVAHGTKMVYIASMDDQVVPIYSGIFATASHPLILRALYIDGDAYHASDFLSNLLVLLTRVLNSGLSDSGLVSLLSEATAGSLSGVGHSTAYEDVTTYSLAVDYLFKTTPGPMNTELRVDAFDAAQEQNDYEIPWSLRDLIADERVRHLFGPEISTLRSMFGQWKPRTAILREVKKKLGPIQRLGNINEGRKSPSKL